MDNMLSRKKIKIIMAFALILCLLPLGGTVFASSQVYINEIQVSTSSTDWEFFELQGTPGTDLSDFTLIGIESDNYYAAGTIDKVISLAGHTIPADGFWLGISPAGAAAYGVTGEMEIANNSFENSTQTYFLVSNFTGTQGDDVDTDNDGVLDVTPWDFALDAINLRDSGASDFDYGAPSVGPDGYYLPSGTYRCPNAPSGTFGSNILNFSSPNGTPGTSNNPTCGIPDVYINEIQVSTTSTDWEFFELQGAPGTDLSDFTLIAVESDNYYAAGTIDKVISLAGQSIPGDGFWLGISPAGATAYGVAGEMAIDNNSFENSTTTYFLVSNFTGAKYDDLDTDNDGVLDVTPWDFVVEAINLRDSGASDFDYGAPSFGPDGYYLPSGIYRCPDAPDGWFTDIHNFGSPDGTPGVTNGCGGGTGPQEVKIHEVQGSGSSVAITDPVIVEAIVVGDYQNGDQLRGFFIQEEDADVDGDPNTSEGILVYCDDCSTDVAVGDLVEVTGTPGDYFGMSQIDASGGTVTVSSSVNPLPSAAVIDLPASGSTQAEATFENVEGMLVTFFDTLFVSEYYQLARFGQLVLTADARPQQFTDAFEPSVPGYAAFLDDLNSKRIILDDDNNIQNDALGFTPAEDEPYFWPRPGLSTGNYIRGGDSITNLTGVLHWSYAGSSGTNAWRLRPVDEAFIYAFSSDNARTVAPDPVGGGLKVASLNVLNYFTTLDSRGADSIAELDRQREKTAAAICGMDSDIVGLIEIENNNPVAIDDLLNGPNGINAFCGPYAYIDTGVIGTDEIAVAFIYKTATAETLGDFAILDSSVDARFNDDKNRPALAQTFMDKNTGGILTVVVNHLKSKGSSCDSISDPNLLDGAGNCNLTRTLAAQAMVDWLAADPTGSGDTDFLIIGDLNAYRNEEPIDALLAGGYTDLLDNFFGASAYSYVFDGQLGYLDYALSSADLLGEVAGVTAWHINADEIPVFDYNDDIQDGGFEQWYERESSSLPIFEPTAFRSSDHDPVLVGLNVCDEIAPTFDQLSVTPDSLWPVNHKYVDITATVLVSDNFDPNPLVELVSVTSNEPDNGEDDGDTVDDIVIIDDYTFQLRAERSGVGTGRIYTITYKVTDACGNSTTQSVTVTVPLSQGN